MRAFMGRLRQQATGLVVREVQTAMHVCSCPERAHLTQLARCWRLYQTPPVVVVLHISR